LFLKISYKDITGKTSENTFGKGLKELTFAIRPSPIPFSPPFLFNSALAEPAHGLCG
jgi:hypothetical protein